MLQSREAGEEPLANFSGMPPTTYPALTSDVHNPEGLSQAAVAMSGLDGLGTARREKAPKQNTARDI